LLEEDLKRIICLHPELIEDGLTIEQEEYPVRTGSTTYRCDLKCKDKEGNTVFIELKLNAGKNVIYQIAKYKTFLNEEGRFMVAAFDFDDEAKQILENLGFEAKKIDIKKSEEVLQNERDNPKLYQRNSILTEKIKTLSKDFTQSLYSNEEKEIVKKFMNALKQIIIDNPELTMGFKVEGGLDIRRKDEYRLLLISDEFPSDRIVIYNRARKREEIHIMYVPDFSFETGSTPKKQAFKKYIIKQKDDIMHIFNLPLFTARQRNKNKFDNRLEITCQAWKGFSRVYTKNIKTWNQPDFIEMVSIDLFDFIENIVPIVKNFYNTYK